MIITFDGPAGSGKSTIAKAVAERLGFIHFNSGSIFRAITAFMLENNKDLNLLKKAKIKVKIKDNQQFVFINNVDYTPILRNNLAAGMQKKYIDEKKALEKNPVSKSPNPTFKSSYYNYSTNMRI